MKNDIDTPSISVIIPTLQSSRTIERCLRSIRACDYPQSQVQIIIIDGHSSDDTVGIARRFGARIVMASRRGPTMARITGLAEATGDIVAFTDADVIVDPLWLKNGVARLMEHPKSAVGGPLQATEQNSFAQAMQEVFELVETFGVQHQIVEREREVMMLPTANMLVPRNALKEFAAMTWDGYGGDHMLSEHLRAKGFTVKLCPDVRVQHLKRDNPLDALVELYKWGKGHPRHSKNPLRYAVDWFIPLAILYCATSIIFGSRGTILAATIACVPFILQAAYAGITKKSFAVAAWSPVAMSCYLFGWSAGFITDVMSKKTRKTSIIHSMTN